MRGFSPQKGEVLCTPACLQHVIRSELNDSQLKALRYEYKALRNTYIKARAKLDAEYASRTEQQHRDMFKQRVLREANNSTLPQTLVKAARLVTVDVLIELNFNNIFGR